MKETVLLLCALAFAAGCAKQDAGDTQANGENGYAVLTLEQAKKLYPSTINARDFGAIPNDGKDDAKALRDALEAAKKQGGGVRIALEKGNYDLMTFDRGAAIPVIGAKAVMFDGNGATLVHHKMYTNFQVSDSSDITVANITFDANEVPFAGAVVTAVGDGYFDCKVIPPHKVKDGAHPKGIISFDQKNDSMGGDSKYRIDNYQLATKLKIKKLSEDTMRVPLEKYARMPKVGDVVLVRYEVYGPGVINSHAAKNLRVYNVTINSHPGMGIHGSDTENILIDNLKVQSKTKDLFMSATADATHFNYCRGRIDILNSTFEKMGDDATNVHQMYWMLSEKLNPQTIKVKWGKERQGGFPAEYLPKLGDTISFGTKDNWLRMETFSKVSKVDVNAKDKFAVISLETPLPDFVANGMPMGNYSSNPVLNIKNCKVRGNRARGFLIKVAEANVENCSFERTTLPAILMENDANYWYEGCRTENVTIKNCSFKDCNFWGAGGKEGIAILDAAAFTKGMPNQGAVNVSTTIENCTFSGCGQDPISIKQTQKPVLKNNTIK